MAKVSFQIGSTPNPNSVRVGLSEAIFPAPRTFNGPDQAEADPLAKKLFGVSGVKSVFMMNDFISINKDAGVAWDAVEPRIARILTDHFS